MESKIVLPANPMEDGTCRPIKRQYQQTSLANLIRGGLRDGEICSTISKSIWEYNYLLVEIVNYEQADKDRQPVRREQRDRLRRKHLGYRGNLTCPDNNGGGNREPIIVEIVRYAESSRGKENTLTLGADSNGTHPRPSAIQALKTCQKH